MLMMMMMLIIGFYLMAFNSKNVLNTVELVVGRVKVFVV